MPALDSALDIINKFVPTQDRRDVITLDDLVFTLAKLTQSKAKDKYRDIAVIRKELERLRQEVDYEKSA